LDFGTSVPNSKLIIGTYTVGNFWSGIGMASSSAGLRIAGDSGSNNLLDVGSYSNDTSHNWTSTMFIGASNVGIGTASPVSKLDFGTSVPNSKLIIGTYTVGNFWSGIGMASSSAGLRIAGDSGSNNLLDVGSYSNDTSHNWTSTMFIGASNVGIGTTSPGARLSVDDSVGNVVTLNSTNANGIYTTYRNSGTDLGYIGAHKELVSGGRLVGFRNHGGGCH
jgi:hypothetical protein